MRTAPSAAILTFALLISVGPTQAADSSSAPSAEEAIQAISQLDDAPVAKPVTEASSPADLPDEAGNSIDFEQTDFAISIPGTAEAEHVAGASVYEQTQPGTTTVVQPTRQGAQILTVLDSAASATDHAYELQIPSGGKATQNADGSIAITDGEGTPEVSIATPWAQDATGRDLTTHYTLDGNTLTQHIDTTGATFPVVADPKVTFDCGWISCSAYFSRNFTQKIADRISDYDGTWSFAVGQAVLAACSKVGHPAGITVCTLVVSTYGYLALDKFKSAARQNKCVRFKFRYLGPPPNLTIHVDDSGYC